MTVPLSSNDFKMLGEAMRRNKEITLERTLYELVVTARTIPLGLVWDRETGVQIRIQIGDMIWLQTFDNIEEARKMCKLDYQY